MTGNATGIASGSEEIGIGETGIRIGTGIEIEAATVPGNRPQGTTVILSCASPTALRGTASPTALRGTTARGAVPRSPSRATSFRLANVNSAPSARTSTRRRQKSRVRSRGRAIGVARTARARAGVGATRIDRAAAVSHGTARSCYVCPADVSRPPLAMPPTSVPQASTPRGHDEWSTYHTNELAVRPPAIFNNLLLSWPRHMTPAPTG